MGFFDGTRGRLHYRDRQIDAAVATLVLLPGTGQHSGHYHEFARRMNAASIAVWTLDTAGQGLSEGDADDPVHLPDLVADAQGFVRLVSARAAESPLVLMGHSLGAATALGMVGTVAAAVPRTTILGGRPVERSPEPASASDDFTALVLCGTPQRVLDAADRGQALPRTLAVHGVDDRRAPVAAVRDWARQHSAVDLREYSDAGHDLLHERVRGRVTTDIVQWIREMVAGPARRR